MCAVERDGVASVWRPLRLSIFEAGIGSQLHRLGAGMNWPDVEARAKRIFGDRVLPNLVLLEREEAPF